MTLDRVLAALCLCLAVLSLAVGCGDDGGSRSPDTDPSDDADTATDAADSAVDDATAPDTADAEADETATVAPENLPFPESFLWGAATAGFQVDMGCPTITSDLCEDRASDWYQFVTAEATLADPSNHLSGDPPSIGPGHWELYPQDFDLLADAVHGNAFRMSLEWSRLFPNATDAAATPQEVAALANADAVAHYHAMFAALKARGITPLVTLNHYTLPTWIHDGVGCHVDLANCSPRGWVDRDRTLTEIAKYARFAAAEFGGEVDLWATLNEPFAVLLAGYILPNPERTNPPAVSAHAEAKVVLEALVTAHARMYDAVKAGDTVDADGDGETSQVGVVYAMAPVAPIHPNKASDVEAAENVFHLWNTVYLDAVILGQFDETLDRNPVYRADLDGRMDYLGVNYYTRIKVEGFGTPVLAEYSPLTNFNPLTFETWMSYPRGIYEVATFVTERYGLPVIITENGVPIEGDGAHVHAFLAEHLTWLARAVRDGAEVRGYFYWSLMDNYEWNHGMGMRFGLFAVDTEDVNKTRSARPFVETYRQIIDANAVPESLQLAWPAPY